ncbi:3'-5' exonuclease family protein [Vibrio mangrovi]|uniref:Exonuclease n=1 Tax=Vibrio mangrovi TaxID=474394 RepID=A0A1Y6IQ40_9VIBR|nr:exonuclease domain-containing protein [Vibrio mangrovi]MDW6003461.1 exonuclease domain-containing protein [Vibrio mangrovi]SMR99748.1 Exonuclease [Vibrio mangrovi]
MNLVFAGVDGEMTGSRVEEHELIQIGVALSESEVFCSRIAWDSFDYNPEALEVIGVTPESIKEGPSAAEVDEQLVQWLKDKGITERSIVPVGWEVAAFDKPFIRKTLPKFYQYLHFHSVELNSVIYTFGDIMPYQGVRPNSATWKKMAKFAATFNIKCEEARWPKKHDAGEDAVMGLMSWRWLRNILAAGNPGHLDVEEKAVELYGRIESVDATRGKTA